MAEAHKRLSSPFLVIFMCSLAAFSILFGEFKRKVLVSKIILCSFFAVVIQAIYISSLNKIIFSIYTFLLHNEWNVHAVILSELGTNSLILSFISPAALFVNVIASIFSGFIPFSHKYAILWV